MLALHTNKYCDGNTGTVTCRFQLLTPLLLHHGRCAVCVAAAEAASAAKETGDTGPTLPTCPTWCSDTSCGQDACAPCAACLDRPVCETWCTATTCDKDACAEYATSDGHQSTRDTHAVLVLLDTAIVIATANSYACPSWQVRRVRRRGGDGACSTACSTSVPKLVH